MEAAPGLVGVMECGVEQLLFVKVMSTNYSNHGLMDGTAPTATCPDLTVPANGVIIYSSSTSPHLQGTVATQSCLNGYVPWTTTSTATRVCRAGRLWSGSSFTCQCKLVQ